MHDDGGVSKDECKRRLWRAFFRLFNGSPGPARERASSRHTDQSGALIYLVVKQGYEIVARLGVLEGWQVVERLEQRAVKGRQKDHPGHAALRLIIAYILSFQPARRTCQTAPIVCSTAPMWATRRSHNRTQ